MRLLRTMIPVPDTAQCPRRELFTGKGHQSSCLPSEKAADGQQAPTGTGVCHSHVETANTIILVKLGEHSPILQRLQGSQRQQRGAARVSQSPNLMPSSAPIPSTHWEHRGAVQEGKLSCKREREQKQQASFTIVNRTHSCSMHRTC